MIKIKPRRIIEVQSKLMSGGSSPKMSYGNFWMPEFTPGTSVPGFRKSIGSKALSGSTSPKHNVSISKNSSPDAIQSITR